MQMKQVFFLLLFDCESMDCIGSLDNTVYHITYYDLLQIMQKQEVHSVGSTLLDYTYK